MTPRSDEELLDALRRARENPRAADAERAAQILDLETSPYDMCDRKKKIRTPEHAAELVAIVRARFHYEPTFYLCPLCNCYHLTHRRGDAA